MIPLPQNYREEFLPIHASWFRHRGQVSEQEAMKASLAYISLKIIFDQTLSADIRAENGCAIGEDDLKRYRFSIEAEQRRVDKAEENKK